MLNNDDIIVHLTIKTPIQYAMSLATSSTSLPESILIMYDIHMNLIKLKKLR